jgi:hypothetical protein
MNQTLLLQQGKHVGQIIKSDFDSERHLLQLTVKFQNEIELPFEFDASGREGERILGDLLPRRQLSDTSQLLNRKAWFDVELMTVKSTRCKFGLNTIVTTSGAYRDPGDF